MEEIKIIVDEIFNNTRIDKVLASSMECKSRSHIQGLIESGNVIVNGKAVKSNYKVKTSDDIVITVPEPSQLDIKAENIDIDIVYEDSDIVIVNKAQGMVVHPAPGNYSGTLVNALLYHCKDLSSINGVIRPGIVHRIDKDTSGLLVVAKNDFAHMKLAEQFKEHSITREYIALVEGTMKTMEGTIDAPLGRHPKDRLKFAIVEHGKRAVTHYKLIENFAREALVLCRLETGRTHQIRVHMASINHPLVGDPVYGFKKQRFKSEGQLLHAKTIGFLHPTKNEYMEFTSDIPEYFEEIIKKLRGN
ncbi:RluA family pseudouridine synthase [Inconstantimicrobium mannanitabidum]|uniref:Pseudouridine synthase n=1 Tax=Inconstantimicrobium mannanitabidum TaxID=1604901 RepID=A0ACB5RB85_9CLOT|nr:RluA family pseudouridine synthase [Clostridium sp. TW13]GKX66129.1 pseudouridine synthase [Clostridium sp. TW13]